MPYTPPSQLSPAVSKNTSPAPSRSQSFLNAQNLSHESTYPSSRPALPRSASSSSYLAKHRRSPSWSQSQETPQSPEERARSNSETNRTAYLENGNIDPNGSIRQSPPPVNHALIPTGATLSPPESSHNSSDDEEVDRRRGRELENLQELQEAIRNIPQRREGSLDRDTDEIQRTRLALEGRLREAANYPTVPPNSTDTSRPPLSREARKISHSRSSTDSNIVFDGHTGSQTMPHSPTRYRDSDEEEDDSDTTGQRPPMIRKKSGELVRPALRPSSKRRPSSMPGTPTYSKAVHFDSHLEHVRHFLQVDRPLAVSAGSSPADAYESEVEFPFTAEEERRGRTGGYEWEIRLTNFPGETEDRNHMPIRVEKVYLSSDNKNLVGSLAVQNLAYQKLVVARFTLDYWKTTSEVVADFDNDVRRKQHNDGSDRFSFTVKLADQANLENKTLFFCVRYNVNGQEHWDNNNWMNFQVDFMKKPKAVDAKQLALTQKPLNDLPRSRPPTAAAAGRPKSMPTSFDDFSSGFESFGSFVQSPTALMGDSPIKLRGPRARVGLVPEAPARRHEGSGQAFGNRYSFSTSLTAAMQTATQLLGDKSGLSVRPEAKQSSHELPAARKAALFGPSTLENGVRTPTAGQVSNALAAGYLTSKPAALASEAPTLQSESYQELVDKYCFFGSSKGSEAAPELTQAALRSLDGANGEMSPSEVSTGSGRSSGSTTPTPPRGVSPSPPSEVSSNKWSPEDSRSSSPLPRAGTGVPVRVASPALGYPFRQPSPNQLLAEAPPATAIQDSF